MVNDKIGRHAQIFQRCKHHWRPARSLACPRIISRMARITVYVTVFTWHSHHSDFNSRVGGFHLLKIILCPNCIGVSIMWKRVGVRLPGAV